MPTKLFVHLSHTFMASQLLPQVKRKSHENIVSAHQCKFQATLTLIEKFYLVLAVPVFLYRFLVLYYYKTWEILLSPPCSEFLHSFIGLSASLPFLPLLLYSLYSAVGITFTYLNFYANYLKS